MGNEKAYYFAENLFAFSASAAIPISQAARAGNLTFRLGAVTAAKEGISVAAGEGASRLTMELSGNRTASMVAGILASGAAGHGLNAVDTKFNISGNNTYQSLLGKMSQKEAEAYEHFLKNGSSAGLTEIEQKALQKADARIALNKVDYNEVLKVRGDGIKGGSRSVIKTQKNVTAPVLPEGSQWERNVLNSFAGGESNPVTYGGGRTLYRIGGKNGGFWSLDPPPATEYQWRVNTAIKQEFCNDGITLYKMTIPDGSSLSGLEGKVGSQGMGLYGGAHQVYVDYRAVPTDWIEITKTTWK